MHYTAEWIVGGLFRAACGMSLAAMLVYCATRLLRLRAPRAELGAWMLVLLQGAIPHPIAVRGPEAVLPEHSLRRSINSIRSSYGPHRDRTSRKPAYRSRGEAAISAALARIPVELALTVWLTGCATCLGVMGWRRYRLLEQIRRAAPVPVEWEQEWLSVQRGLGISNGVQLAGLPEVPAGLRRVGGHLLISSNVWKNLSRAERIVLLRHAGERPCWDGWLRMFANLIVVLQWFNPVAWWCAWHMRLHADLLADQTATKSDPTILADALVRIGRTTSTQQSTWHPDERARLVRIHRLLMDVPQSPRWQSMVLVSLAAVAVLAAFRLA